MGMIADQYLENLNISPNNSNVASRRATIYHSFERTSKSSFAAAKLYHFHREMIESETYQDPLSDVDSRLMTARSAMQSIYSTVSSAESGNVIQATTGAMSENDHTIIASKMRQIQQAFLSLLNTEFGEEYLFGGTEMIEAPPSVSDSGELLYRGINANTGKTEAGPVANFNGTLVRSNSSSPDPIIGPDIDYTVEDGIILKIADSGVGSKTNISTSDDYTTIKVGLSKYEVGQDLLNLAKGYDKIDFSKIRISSGMNRSISVSNGIGKYQEIVSASLTSSIGQDGLFALTDEEVLVNLGLGLKATAGANSTTTNSQSAFNSAIPGISFLGRGQDSSRISGSLYALMGQIVSQLESDDFSAGNIQPYLDKFGEKSGALPSKITKSNSKSGLLSTMKTNLESIGDSLLEHAKDIEYIDPGDATMDLHMQQYTYNAALLMGIKIFSKLFIDFIT